MAKLDIGQAQTTDFENTLDEYEIDALPIDSPGMQQETAWSNDRSMIQWGYFNAVPDLKSAILMKAIWNVGKGYKCDSATEIILDDIKGWGKDSFDDILFNMEVSRRVFGDAYALIVRDDNQKIINLQVLNPQSIKHIVGSNGQIIRYEQMNNEKVTTKKIMPEDMFHLCNNRIADQIHGISDIDVMEKTILAEEQSFDDVSKVMHRQAKPLIMFKLKTDNEAKITEFISKMDKATNKGDNIYIPDDENTVSYEVVQVDVSAMILEWRTDIRNKFYRALGLPLILFGSPGSTESGGKMEYYAHEQVFEHDQRYIEKQVWNQLHLKIDLIPPQSMMNSLAMDAGKDGAAQQMNIQPSDMMAGVGK